MRFREPTIVSPGRGLPYRILLLDGDNEQPLEDHYGREIIVCG
jgi:hypothetical protein